MIKPFLNPEYCLYERNGKAFCSSRQVAETFVKRHDNVLQDIRSLDCSANFRLLNFQESSYLNEQRKRQPEYLMSKDGFTFLAMGYRGKKAASFKEAYIKRFNDMEAFIKYFHAAKLEHPAFAEAVMQAHPEPRHYHFSNEVDMINRIVLGIPAKVIRESNGLKKGESIRPYLTEQQIRAIEALQRIDIGLLYAVPEFEKRRLILQGHFASSALRASNITTLQGR